MALRPGHVTLEKGEGHIKAKIEAIVYLGTDTHFHTLLEDGQKIIVRQKNHIQGAEFKQGEIVTLHVQPRSGRLFRGGSCENGARRHIF